MTENRVESMGTGGNGNKTNKWTLVRDRNENAEEVQEKHQENVGENRSLNKRFELST